MLQHGEHDATSCGVDFRVLRVGSLAPAIRNTSEATAANGSRVCARSPTSDYLSITQ